MSKVSESLNWEQIPEAVIKGQSITVAKLRSVSDSQKFHVQIRQSTPCNHWTVSKIHFHSLPMSTLWLCSRVDFL